MAVKQQLKSKTNLFNIGVGALIPLLKYYGVELPPSEILFPVIAFINIIIRQFTNKPISEK
jgi:transcriptional antiterminator